MRICNECDEEKPLSMFYKHPRDRGGVMFKCKECHKAAMKKRRADKRTYREVNGLVKPRPYPHWVVKHGHKRRGRESPEHQSWSAMLSRCRNPNNKDWNLYGGRGVTVCQEWQDSFEHFLADMGPRPEGRTLDRIDSYGNYEPGNCRWADHVTQRRNQRRSA